MNGIPSSEVLAELEALCAHPEFARSRRQVEFLRFVVLAVLRGEGDQLKEYTVAVGALGKGSDFDPKIDSSVRSEASRIRSKLDAIYDAEPAAHAVRLVLPKGHYRPTFERAAAPDAPVAGPGLTTANPNRWSVAYYLVPVMVMAAVVAAWLRIPSSEPPTFQVTRFDAFNGDRAFPKIAPDGRLAVFSETDGTAPFLFLSRPQGQPIAMNQQGEHAAWSPDGRQIVFRSERNGGGLFLLDMTTKEVRPIANAGFHPDWSPDGTRIVFSSEAFIRPEQRPTTLSVLSIVDLASGASRPVTMSPPLKDAIQPAWSPDGKWIAFWSVHSGGRRDVFVVAASGGTPVRITEPDPLDWNPAWSPDGFLYWSSNTSGTANLWRTRIGPDGAPAGRAEQIPLPSTYAANFSFDREGGLLYANIEPLSSIFRTTIAADGLSAAEPVRLTPETQRVRHPSLSPDGQRFVANVLDSTEDLVVFRRDGTEMRRLTQDAFLDRGPVWSPDGTRIVFVSNRSGDYQLWSIQPDGQSLLPITNHPAGAFAPVWSADGRRVAWFERGYRVNVTRADVTPPTSAPLKAALAFVPTEWWNRDRELLGEAATDDSGSDRPLGSHAIDTGAWQPLAVTGRGPHWLVEGRILLFLRDRSLYSFNPVTREERRLLTVSGVPDSRLEMSRPERTMYFEMRESRVELWTARLR